ncbi:MAG: hypothetical protein WD810_08690 [Solirubrobacterales bacterium]
MGLEDAVGAAGGDVAATLTAGAEAAADPDVDVGDGAEAGGDQGDVEGGAVAEAATAPFDRDDDRVGLGAGHGGAGVDDDGRTVFQARAVEEGQWGARRDGAAGEGDQRVDPAAADDRPAAGLARFLGARLGDPFRRAGGEAVDAEPTVAVEVDDRLFQRNGRAAVFGGEVDVAPEFDRRKLGARQLSRPEAAVGVEDQVVDFNDGRGCPTREQRRQHAAEERGSLQCGA